MPEMTSTCSIDYAAVPLTPSQLAEVWAIADDPDASAEAITLISRMLSLRPSESQEDIFMELMYQHLRFAKLQAFTAAKTLTMLSIIGKTHARTVESEGDKSDVFRFFSATSLDATKAMAPHERFTLKEVEVMVAHVRSTLIDHMHLFRLVFTQPQTIRRSELELFVQQPMPSPLPLAHAREAPAEQSAVDGAADAKSEGEGAPAEGAPGVLAPGEAPGEAPAPAGESPENEGTRDEGSSALSAMDEQLAAAINAAMSSYMGELKSQISAEHATREAEIRARIERLEGGLQEY